MSNNSLPCQVVTPVVIITALKMAAPMFMSPISYFFNYFYIPMNN